ncbi:BZ3500_MvSof-1268-A1-R1_Chr9g10398 [Microbotryum saponariae]|uniref:BZ3500_MvSof-1268-A1-R1_Chr9g10398 protein n=1 Tax=Microbotryum saponariae TaxID=289078 RepID=A0A2X0MDX4_9BASI|nr:BZ3501_MvSof-1269-A2-R1_Chr9g10148 [Microbotryum saponariae]SDA00026.1 BZ3500_MvSof-1268-A1-R1_Chr9g10398 [Microbotryum saponariae]
MSEQTKPRLVIPVTQWGRTHSSTYHTTKIHAFLNAKPYLEWNKVSPRFTPRVHLLTAHFLNRAYPSTFASPLRDGDNKPWLRLFAHFTNRKANDVVRYVRLAFDAQRHSGKDGFEVIERAPEDLIRDGPPTPDLRFFSFTGRTHPSLPSSSAERFN